jgi:hypothetical protein
MSMGAPFTSGSAEAGETVASFSQYEKAQKAVSSLIAADVPAKEIAIVGQGLRSIERVTGRLGYATAARSGAVNGLVLGVLFAFIFVLGTPTVAIQAFVGVLLVGIAIGMLLSLVTYSVVRRRRDYASVMQVVADHYDVRVVASSVHRARAALGTAKTAEAVPAAASAVRPEPARPASASPEHPHPVQAAPHSDDETVPSQVRPESAAPDPERQRREPPRYGERITPQPAAPAEPGAAEAPERPDRT